MLDFFMLYRMVQRRIENLEWLGFRFDRNENVFRRKQEMLTPEFIRNASISEWEKTLDRLTCRA